MEIRVYFKIPFFKYFIAYQKDYKSLCLCYKIFINDKYEWYIV